MTVANAYDHFDHKAHSEKIGWPYFPIAGTVTVGEILIAIEGRCGEDYINLGGPVDRPEIVVCTRAELPKFSALG